MLQNLAWLGEDGTIHTVKKPEGMNGQWYGASAPQTAPMVGAWLDEDGQIKTINDLQNLNLGAWLEDGEVKTINDLQDLKLGAWLGEDGTIHTVNDLQNLALEPYSYYRGKGEDLQNLRIGAWLGEDGDIHTVNDLQNLRLGAWLDEDGEIRTVNDLQNLGMSKAEIGQIAMGVLEGALKTEGLNDYVTCLQDSETVVGDIEDAVVNFEKKSISGITAGLTDLANALKQITSDIKLCSQQKDIDQLKKLEKMIATFKDPKTFAYHVGKDILVNGVNIYHEITDAVTQYKAGKYEAFGQDVGDSLALVLIGTQQQKAKKAKKLQVLLI